jgi:ribulose-phosphate 3-epimerase
MPRSPLVDHLRVSAPQISVGVLTADWMTLSTQLTFLEDAGVQLLHFDIMDGTFCPMLTFGAPIVAGLKTPLLKDVHLMIEEPLTKIEGFVAAGADIISIQVESTRHPHRVLHTLGQMKNVNDATRGIVRGIALNPGTPIEAIKPLRDELEMVLILAVNPGWGGQKFIASTRERVRALREKVGKDVLICVDGGITKDNISEVANMGADIIVTGSAVFDGKAPLDNARYMIDACQRSCESRNPV